MRILVSAVCLAAAIASLSTHAQQSPTLANSELRQKNVVEALQEREILERDLATQMAEIKSRADLNRYLAKSRNDSPLSLLSAGAKQRFVQSLRFSDRGLASFDYRDLRDELTASQIYRILSLFGAERTTASIPNLRVSSTTDELILLQRGGVSQLRMTEDYPGFACISRASCAKAADHICIGSSC